MEMIRMLNLTQSSVVSCHIKFTIRLSSPFLLIWPAPMHFISLFNCVEKCCQKKNRAWYTEYSKQIMTAWHVGLSFDPSHVCYHKDVNVFLH